MTLKRKLTNMKYRFNGFIATRILRMTPAELFTVGLGLYGLGDQLNEAYFSSGRAVAKIAFIHTTPQSFALTAEIESPHKDPREVEP